MRDDASRRHDAETAIERMRVAINDLYSIRPKTTAYQAALAALASLELCLTEQERDDHGGDGDESRGDESPGALARALKAARRHQGLTLREVERRTGIPNAHVSQIENGHIAAPSSDVCLALAECFGLDAATLLAWAGHSRTAAALSAPTAEDTDG